MTGLWLIAVFLLLVLFIILTCRDEDYAPGLLIFGIIFLIFVICIPTSRRDSKANVVKMEVYIQQSKLTDKVVSFYEVNKWNNKIVDWNEKSKWYQNGLYYHSSTRNLKYLK